MTFRVIGMMEDGQDHCLKDGFKTEESACKWCDYNEDNYPETSLFVEQVPTACELIYGF